MLGVGSEHERSQNRAKQSSYDSSYDGQNMSSLMDIIGPLEDNVQGTFYMYRQCRVKNSKLSQSVFLSCGHGQTFLGNNKVWLKL